MFGLFYQKYPLLFEVFACLEAFTCCNVWKCKMNAFCISAAQEGGVSILRAAHLELLLQPSQLPFALPVLLHLLGQALDLCPLDLAG